MFSFDAPGEKCNTFQQQQQQPLEALLDLRVSLQVKWGWWWLKFVTPFFCQNFFQGGEILCLIFWLFDCYIFLLECSLIVINKFWHILPKKLFWSCKNVDRMLAIRSVELYWMRRNNSENGWGKEGRKNRDSFNVFIHEPTSSFPLPQEVTHTTCQIM